MTTRSKKILENVLSIGGAILTVVLIKALLIQNYRIPSESMVGTLLPGDYLVANKAIYGNSFLDGKLRVPGFRDPQRGEVVVFTPSYNPPGMYVVKRVVGIAGDTVEMRDAVLYRNGHAQVEPYVVQKGNPDHPLAEQNPEAVTWQSAAMPRGTMEEDYIPTRDNWGPVVVPDSTYFLLGDNREESLDSRYMGFIPRREIRGKAWWIYYSSDPENPGARWERVGRIQ